MGTWEAKPPEEYFEDIGEFLETLIVEKIRVTAWTVEVEGRGFERCSSLLVRVRV